MPYLETVRAATNGRGVYVVDRGGDRMKLFGPFFDRKMRTILSRLGHWTPFADDLAPPQPQSRQLCLC